MNGSEVSEIVVVSGKGGTGKTTVSASLAFLSREAVVTDCDVDAANLSLLLRGIVEETHEFSGVSRARIDESRCNSCGLCREACRSGAADPPRVDDILCEGCGLCMRLCPTQAIEMHPRVSGQWYVSKTVRGPMIHAHLEPGGDNSGMLVTAVRSKARELCLSERRSLIITDGPPGIGCPVISSLSGADLALLVAEPTLSGLHDLARVMEVCRRLDVRTAVCINKYDINLDNTEQIRKVAGENCPVVGLIPYDDAVPRAMAEGLPVVAIGGPAACAIADIWSDLQKMLLGPASSSRRVVSVGP